MNKPGKMIHGAFAVIVSPILVLTGAYAPVFAFNRNFFADNNILFYNPEEGVTGDIDCLQVGGSTVTGSGYERLQNAVKTYGETAMQMQREYGTPWEVVFAQMQVESGVGTAGHAVNGATNNWLGITGEGDAGYYLSPNGRKWAKYTSVEASILAWGGRKVLRNGYYDAAFPYLDPNNYDLQNFLIKMISVYAPSSDGNDEAAYVSNVLSFINGPIKTAREEKGWPSSAELAKNENIPVGGQNPIGANISSGGGGTNTNNVICPSELVSGGMTLEQAEAFMEAYKSLPNPPSSEGGTLFSDYDIYNAGCVGGGLANCVAFSNYFINRYTTGTWGGGSGRSVVDNLIANGFTDGGSTPRAYAVFGRKTGSTVCADGNPCGRGKIRPL